MRYRDSRSRWRGDGGGDSRHYFKFDIVFQQSLYFLAATSEDKGVTALEAEDFLSCQGFAYKDFFNFMLRYGVTSALFADIDRLFVCRDE